MKLYKKLLVALIITSIALIGIFLHSKKHTIIMFTGTSSAGKTSIIEAFQAQAPDTYQLIKIDDFNMQEPFEALAASWGWDKKTTTLNDFMDNYLWKKAQHHPRLETDLSSGVGHDIHQAITDATYHAFFAQAKDKAQKGNSIIDTVFDSATNYQQFIANFKDLHPIKVLVYAPLDVIQERVEKRNASGKPEEQRTAFQAFPQFVAIYKLQASPDEQIVDTIATERILKALKKATDDLIQTLHTNDSAQEKLQEQIASIQQFQADFIKAFKLEELTEITIVARHAYDIILNSEQSPQENAQKVQNFPTTSP